MALTKQEMERLQQLARLDLADDEATRLGHQLDRILGYVARLSNVDTEGVPEMEQFTESRSLRADEPRVCDESSRELIMANFPERAMDALRVPAVFEKPKG